MAKEVIKEGSWKCPNCDSRNKGRELHCPGCGQARESVQFDYDSAGEEARDAQLAQARAGADWVCAYCSTSNRAAASKCGQCGAGSDEGQRRAEKDVGRAPAPAAKPVAGGMPWPIKIAAALLVAIVLLFIGAAFWTTEASLPLVAKDWERHITIETRQWVRHGGWADSIPAGARILDTESRVYKTRKVQTGTESVKVGVKDMGNGYFKEIYEDRPIYREEEIRKEYATYEVQEWKEARRVSTTGGATDEPAWGRVLLAGGEREGARSESYRATFRGEKDHVYTTSLEPWRALELGRTYTVTMNGFGSVTGVR